MTFLRGQDIDAMFAALALEGGAVDVTVGSTTVKGLVDTRDESLLTDTGAEFQAQTVVVTVKTGALPGLSEGVALTADGVAYQVTRVAQVHDGALTEVNVALA